MPVAARLETIAPVGDGAPLASGDGAVAEAFLRMIAALAPGEAPAPSPEAAPDAAEAGPDAQAAAPSDDQALRDLLALVPAPPPPAPLPAAAPPAGASPTGQEAPAAAPLPVAAAAAPAAAPAAAGPVAAAPPPAPPGASPPPTAVAAEPGRPARPGTAEAPFPAAPAADGAPPPPVRIAEARPAPPRPPRAATPETPPLPGPPAAARTAADRLLPLAGAARRAAPAPARSVLTPPPPLALLAEQALLAAAGAERAAPAPSAAEPALTVQSSAEAAEGAAIDRQLDLALDGEWLDQLAKDIARTASADGAPLRFRLNPEHLGSLRVEIAGDASGTSVRFTADSEAARTIIADAQPRLVSEARAQGLRIAETHVDLGGGQHGGSGEARRQNEAFHEAPLRTARVLQEGQEDAAGDGKTSRRSAERYA